jgi:transcriptional regulator with XRE-family HTH domain
MHKIKEIRKELGLTQRQLASELGLAKNGDVYIRKVENGRAEPSGLLMRAVEMFYQLKKLGKK